MLRDPSLTKGLAVPASTAQAIRVSLLARSTVITFRHPRNYIALNSCQPGDDTTAPLTFGRVGRNATFLPGLGLFRQCALPTFAAR